MRSLNFLLVFTSILIFKNPLAGIRHDLFIGFLAIIAMLAFIPLFTYAYFAADLTTEEKLTNKKDTGIVLLDRNGEPFFAFYQARLKKEVPLEKIPKHTQEAVIAIEDKDFYAHVGFSPKAMIRALVEDIRNQELAYGASTITQQLVKNSLLTPKKDFFRKYQEIVLANEIERRYSKKEILAMYLNNVYFGEGAFGIEEAALTYFDKNAADLSLEESALLAALLPSPTRLSPFNGGFEEAKIKQKIVLEKMVQQGYISLKQKDEAEKKEIVLSKTKDNINVLAPHFALMVRDKLIDQFGEEEVIRSGFRVKTTLDSAWQKYAEKVVSEQVDKLKANRVSNGVVVVMDPSSGEVRVLVGSEDWYDNKFGKVNVAISPRPPGSAFKPVVYLRAFERGLITPGTVLKDQNTTFANFDEASYFSSYSNKEAALLALKNDPNAYYKPQNYDRRFRGPVTVRRALANSLNVPAVEVIKKVGVLDTVQFATTLGISTLDDPANYGLSLGLGAVNVSLLELTNFYATLANHGQKNTPTTILEIKNKNGEIIYEHQPENEKVADERDVFLLTSILSDNKARTEMFGNALTVSIPAAVKTGTTDDFKDAWTLGFTPSLAVGVWVGNNFGEPMDHVAGSLGAAPIWKSLIEEFSKDKPQEKFEPPLGVISVQTCEASSSAGLEYFKAGTEPKRNCQFNPKPKSKPEVKPEVEQQEQIIILETVENSI